MGACVSHSHNKKASSIKVKRVSIDSTTKLDHKMMIHSSSSNGKLSVMDDPKPQLPPSQLPATYYDYGSKEETFFDSQAWLDSDCESDFMSVNDGEFTPSRRNTPVHHSLTRVNEPVINSILSPSPTHKMMSLLELFNQSLRDHHSSREEIVEPPNKDVEMGLTKVGSNPKRENPIHGCFTSLLSVRSTGRQTKKGPYPSLNVAPISPWPLIAHNGS